MKIEKLCEYLNDIGLLQLSNINTFLKIYSQISHNKYKNPTDKLALALFSYLGLVSKNEQHLYDVCKNIVESFSNNQIIQRYRGIKLLRNILKSKLHSRFNTFLSKLNTHIYRRQNRNRGSPRKKYYNDNYNNSNNLYKNKNLYNSLNNEDSNNMVPMKKGRIVKKNKNKNNNESDTNDNISPYLDNKIEISSLEEEKECTFSPRINKNYKPKSRSNSKNARNVNLNYNYDDYKFSPNKNKKKLNQNLYYSGNLNNNRYTPFKNNTNYGHNNVINDEIEKLYEYYNDPNNNPDNYYKSKTQSRFFPMNSNRGTYPYLSNQDNYNYNVRNYPNPNYMNYCNGNNNSILYHYYDNNYDFYRKGQEHVKKVEDKILQMKIQKFNELSEACTFSPIVHSPPRYINKRSSKGTNKGLNRCLTSTNLQKRNYLNIDDNSNDKKNPSNQKIIKMKNNINKIIDDYADDYYKNYPQKQISKKRPRSYSASKIKNNQKEDSIYKKREIEIRKERMFPFFPNIKYGVEVKSTFADRQNKYLSDKEENEKKIKDELDKKQKEYEKKYKRPKKEVEEIFKNLYDKKTGKDKEKQLDKEKEKEKSKKKKPIIDWDARIKKNTKESRGEYEWKNKPKKKSNNNQKFEGKSFNDFIGKKDNKKDNNEDNKEDNKDKKENKDNKDKKTNKNNKNNAVNNTKGSTKEIEKSISNKNAVPIPLDKDQQKDLPMLDSQIKYVDESKKKEENSNGANGELLPMLSQQIKFVEEPKKNEPVKNGSKRNSKPNNIDSKEQRLPMLNEQIISIEEPKKNEPVPTGIKGNSKPNNIDKNENRLPMLNEQLISVETQKKDEPNNLLPMLDDQLKFSSNPTNQFDQDGNYDIKQSDLMRSNSDISLSINLEEKAKQFEKDKLLDNIKGKSAAINQLKKDKK